MGGGEPVNAGADLGDDDLLGNDPRPSTGGVGFGHCPFDHAF
jgi:hypothetical protein